jgi:hypothetical protein
MVGGSLAKGQTVFNYSQRAEPSLASRGLDEGATGRIAPECGCSSVDRVLASEAKGRGFDPRQPHHRFFAQHHRLGIQWPFWGCTGFDMGSDASQGMSRF